MIIWISVHHLNILPPCLHFHSFQCEENLPYLSPSPVWDVRACLMGLQEPHREHLGASRKMDCGCSNFPLDQMYLWSSDRHFPTNRFCTVNVCTDLSWYTKIWVLIYLVYKTFVLSMFCCSLKLPKMSKKHQVYLWNARGCSTAVPSSPQMRWVEIGHRQLSLVLKRCHNSTFSKNNKVM